MPLYELVCLARPQLPRPEIAKLMQRIGSTILDRGGVLTDIRSYGDQHLAYDIRRPYERYSQAHFWQMDFMIAPEALNALNHELRVDPNVLRWMTVKRKAKIDLTKNEDHQSAAPASAPSQP